jgi:hypothetical protein
MKTIIVDNNLTNADWTKANAFDFPSVKNLADFEKAMMIPSDPVARRTKLASYAGMAWFPVAPDDIRHAIIEAARQQDLVKMLKSKGLPALEKSKLKDDLFMVLVAEKLSKVSFGGDRSEAGRFAANMRWKDHVKVGKPDGSDRLSALRTEVDRVTRLVQGLHPPSDHHLTTVQRPEDWATADYAGAPVGRFLVPNNRNSDNASAHSLVLVTKSVMDAEIEVNALGKKILEQAVTDLESDPAYVALQKIVDGAETSTESETLKALDKKVASNDPSLPSNIRETITKLEEAQAVSKKIRADLAEARKNPDNTGLNAWNLKRQLKVANQRTKYLKTTLETRLANWDEYGNALQTVTSPSASNVRAVTEAKTSMQQMVFGSVIKVVGEMRDFGGEKLKYESMQLPGFKADTYTARLEEERKKLSRDTTVAGLVSYVETIFPTDMIRRLNNHVVPNSKVGNTLRILALKDGGSYNDDVHLIKTGEERSTFAHEIIHAITYNDPTARLLESAIRQRRTFGRAGSTKPFAEKIMEGQQKIKMGYGGSGYIKDSFRNEYMGRRYNDGTNRLPATELLTVGFNMLQGEGLHWSRDVGYLDTDVVNTVVGWLATGGS